MKVSEIITQIGLEFFPDKFSIDIEGRRVIYQQVYETMYNGLIGRNKSVFLIGSVGFGKSVCFKIMQKLFKNTDRRFKITSSQQIKDFIDSNENKLFVKEEYGYGYKGDLYIDDIGLGEAVSKVYGNHINIISEILIERYKLFIDEGYRTHLSSNRYIDVKAEARVIDPSIVTLKQLYGDTVVDRISEMCKIIYCKGQSLRKL